MKGFATAIVLMLAAGAGGDDLRVMQGQWSATIVEMDGKPAPDGLKSIKIVMLVAGDEYRVLAEDKAIAGGKLKLGTRATPHTLDVMLTEGPHRGMTQKGIYAIDGDTMTAVFARPGGARPTAFKTKEGSEQSLVRYTRITK